MTRMMKTLKSAWVEGGFHWTWYLLAALLFGWPFLGFPLTDGDIAHWVGWAHRIGQTGYFLSAGTDQAHGPLLPWVTGLFEAFFSGFWVFNVLNGACGVLGLGLVYHFARRFWGRVDVAQVAAFFYLTSLITVYLSRTPMYDWPAAVFYFGFCGFLFFYLSAHRRSDLIWALVMIALSSLCRFSISLGLAGIYTLLLLWILRIERPIRMGVIIGALVAVVAVLVNLPWILVQAHYHPRFIPEFLNDNVLRFFRDHPEDAPKGGRYLFVLDVLLGIFPYTFLLVTSIFQKQFFRNLKQDVVLKVLLAGLMPCLLIFSFSGHTKMLRYIAYVYPFVFVLMAYHFTLFDAKRAEYVKRTRLFLGGMAVLALGLWGILRSNLRKKRAKAFPLWLQRWDWWWGCWS